MEYLEGMDSLAGALVGLGTLGLVLIIAGAVIQVIYRIVSYVFTAVSLHTMANRRGINHGWFAWLPVFRLWVLGSLSDHYQREARRESRRRRQHLIRLTVLSAGNLILLSILLSTLQVLIAQGGRGGYVAESSVGFLTAASLFAAALILGFQIAMVVLRHMCRFDIYRAANPKRGVLFLVLGIFFPFLIPFFLFASRKTDLGLPQVSPYLADPMGMLLGQ